MRHTMFFLFAMGLTIEAQAEGGAATAIVEDAACQIEFEGTHGGLRRIANRLANDECLKGGNSGTMPFRIYADPSKEFEVSKDGGFEEPGAIARTLIEPGVCSVKEAARERGLTLVYQGGGLEIELRIDRRKQAGTSDWFLRIRNIGDAPREFLACFPYLDGIRLGPDPKGNMATAMDQGGLLLPAWERGGGVLGESNQLSMQWHAIWDPASKSALGLIFMDAAVRPKRLVLKEPSLGLHHFPPVTLAPGASIDFPAVRMIVYQGDWRPAARAYRAWYDAAYTHAEPPAWFRESNGNAGIHFRKGNTPKYGGQVALDSFRDLPSAHLRAPIDNWEYAFFCQTSARLQDGEYTPHTDGDNVVREDMGGAEALREGFAGDHRLGLHATLYIEGYIVHEESDLAKSGRAKRWSVMHKDGTIAGNYTKQGFFHMCAGCTEWQDHLASTVARLLRDTGADAIRLDSLGFYYLPCYSPEHHHDTPFGYNQWLGALLSKVRNAAIAVNPDVLLLTEGSADWVGQWFHGALTSRCPRDLSPMRLAVGPFRTYVYASGALWGSLSGFPGGGCYGQDVSTPDWNWLCARYPAHKALVWGDVADDDPLCSDPEIVTRRFEGDGYWAIVAARPASQDPIWPRGTGVASHHREFTVTVPGLASQVADAVLCDIETLTWTPIEIRRAEDALEFSLISNWAMIMLRKPGGPAIVGFDPLPQLEKGGTATLHLGVVNSNAEAPPLFAVINAPGLVVSPCEVRVPGKTAVQVPQDALAGNYAVSVSGKNLLGAKRFLVVR